MTKYLVLRTSTGELVLHSPGSRQSRNKDWRQAHGYKLVGEATATQQALFGGLWQDNAALRRFGRYLRMLGWA